MASAIVLLSGGVDSTTTLAIAKVEGYEIYALSFNYGQRHAIELEAAKQIAKHFQAKEHLIIDIDLRRIGGSALTDDIEVPKDRSLPTAPPACRPNGIGRTGQAGDAEVGGDIPITYVPARNTIFLSFALAWAEVLGVDTIFIGVNALDYCVPGTMDVMTQKGLRKMQDLRVGDYVLSYGEDGLSWKPVIFHALSPKQERLLKIYCGQNLFECTDNHHMLKVEYVRKPHQRLRLMDKKYRMLLNKRVVHVQARDLKIGDYLLLPAQEVDIDSQIPEEFDFTPYISLVQWKEEKLEIKDGKVGRITGIRNYLPLKCKLSDVLTILAWYVTEGWITSSNGICISQHNQENIHTIMHAIEAIELKANFESGRDGDKTIFFSHPILSTWFKTLGTKAQDKHLPDWCLGLSNKYLNILFESLVKGDGSWQRQAKLYGKPYDALHVAPHFSPALQCGEGEAERSEAVHEVTAERSEHFYCDFYSTSEVLLKQTIYIATRLGYRASIQKTSKSGTYAVRFSKPRSRLLNGASLARITAIDQIENSSDLYDITVEKNHTFVGGSFGFIIAGQSGYPDCRPEYIEAYQRMANLATKAGVEGKTRLQIKTPLINLTKAEIIKKGLELGVDYGLTHSCYDPTESGAACGRCDSCLLRRKGFQEAGVPDPKQ
jgi:queuosine biosynthesis protein QueC